MSKSAKSMENLQRQASLAQQQIQTDNQQTFSQMNSATSIADNMSMTTALGSVNSAQIGAATNGRGTNNAADTLAGQTQAASLNKFSAVRAQAPSLLPSQDNVQAADYRQMHRRK